jgi:hypothetical protein
MIVEDSQPTHGLIINIGQEEERFGVVEEWIFFTI